MSHPNVVISRQGMPFTPPVIDGEFFYHLSDDLWLALVTEEKAAHMTRIPAYQRFGGKVPDGFFGGYVQPAVQATAPAPDPAPGGEQKASDGQGPGNETGGNESGGNDDHGPGNEDDSQGGNDGNAAGLHPDLVGLTRKQLVQYAFEKFGAELELGKLADLQTTVQGLIDKAKPKE